METMIPIVTLLLAAAAVVLLAVLVLRSGRTPDGEALARKTAELLRPALDELRDEVNDSAAQARNESLNDSARMGQLLQTTLTEQLAGQQRGMTAQLGLLEGRILTLERTNEQKLESMRAAMNDSLRQLRAENAAALKEIQGTVDEKLQSTLEKRIAESFRTVSERLEQVHQGLGEMQTLASDVGGLKKVLSGVKTRGILGELQLGAILQEILSPEQYETNVATIPGSANRVEFAVRLPGENGTVYLPIDSKFPGDRYAALLEAQESGDRAAAEQAWKQLETTLRSEAKDIRDKYVAVPYTTNFGILFLPFEGLYAEVVNRGLVEQLQRDFRINIAGPSTMAALLNSLQLGFRTLAIQKRSSEVWQLLGEVKTEFDKFEEVLLKMQKHLNQTSGDLDTLLSTRSNAIRRKLRSVEQLEDNDSALPKLP